jgi:uncharacterized protein YdeI (YjbR/CyaY-like superfamily)
VPADPHPVVLFEDAAAWAAWLEQNHLSAAGIWLRIRKKSASIRALTYPEAVEEALCYGWIDGQTKSFDDSTFIQRFTPRRKGSIWSKINREKVLALAAAGRMRPAGLAEIEKAKANGRWDNAYSGAAPPELDAALARNAKARKFYATLDSRNRMAIHFRIQTPRTPAGRARKLTEFVRMLAEGRTPF